MSNLNYDRFFEKNTKAIVQGFSKNGVFRYEMKSNNFLSDCSSICTESAYQKLWSQRVYLYLKTMDLYVQF